MRILANYGYKTNGDTYCVTFETMGDVPLEKAPQAVDELFRLAKESIQRQLAGSSAPSTPQPVPVVIPQTKEAVHTLQANADGKQPQLKDPKLPATSRQIGLIKRLARQKGWRFDNFTDMTMGEASAKIKELMAL
ncbi:MAG: hypothetical protein HYT88_03685 [Candidatus Omnitrophica bacterium]|nr:hypothetical protein [Candidatus Omnitrophota bacterium]